ncbi:pyridoxal-phosphate dependent enzyme [Octadecabacter sp. R77987]|uniref:pyridoxal-phosphate dependent enzyme n=1 Tax=Octadecabacter sp. R77987 TaxID=3093874 RepID=UPI003672CFA1
MTSVENRYRGTGLSLGVPAVSIDAAAPAALLARCPEAGETPLVRSDAIAAAAGVAQVWIKDERARMGLGSFKALGAAYVIAHDACVAGLDMGQRCYVTASAGNHGLSVAAGARVFGARAVVYLADTVPESFADRLRGQGADVVRAGAIYEDSMAAASLAALDNGWQLLSDSSWDGYVEVPHRLMEGYLVLAAEIAAQMDQPPTHVFLQAGVGGLAAATAAYLRHIWGDGPQMIVVEPQAAPALLDSISAGRFVAASGPASCMGRLDCKEASLIALQGLSRDADAFMTISEDQAQAVLPLLADAGLATSASGGAGVAALMGVQLDPSARVLCIVSEEPAA